MVIHMKALVLSKSTVDALERAPVRYIKWDSKITGFGVRVMPSGVKSFVFVYRALEKADGKPGRGGKAGRAGKLRWYTIGAFGDWTADQAREEAENLRAAVNRGADPMSDLQADRRASAAAQRAPKRSLESIVKTFVERHAKKNNRSWKETERILNRHVVPAWGKRQITDINRADVNELLDAIEDKSGAPMASAVLAQVRKMFAWHAARDDKFNSPIVRGMSRVSPKKMRRDRVLSDDEIRVLWASLDASTPPYRQLVRFLLLTAQRREEGAQIQKGELRAGALWEIPADRVKTGLPQIVPLSPFANEQIEDLGDLRKLGAYQFTTTGDRSFSGFSKAKARLDVEMERLLKARAGVSPKSTRKLLKPWRLHDLRRTAKTLMQRAGVRPDISERVLGHVIPGVEGTYDRYSYADEKRAALNALATEIKFVLTEPRDFWAIVAGEISSAAVALDRNKVVPLKVVSA